MDFSLVLHGNVSEFQFSMSSWGVPCAVRQGAVGGSRVLQVAQLPFAEFSTISTSIWPTSLRNGSASNSVSAYIRTLGGDPKYLTVEY